MCDRNMNLDLSGCRTGLILKEPAVRRLKEAHVLIAGCGAVGGMAAEVLARTGVGQLTLVDFDVFEASNLNRQIWATVPVLGQAKTTVAAQRLLSINPQIRIHEKQMKIEAETLPQLFDAPVDFVIDAIDSLGAKTNLIEALSARQQPFVSAMGAALKTDMSRVRVSAMKKTIECPLAAFVRKRLRRRGVDLSFPVVWSDECVSDKAALGDEPDANGRFPMGSLMTITALFGLMCAQEAILYLTRNPKSFYHGYF